MQSRVLPLWLLCFGYGQAQPGSLPQGPHRMEIVVERLDGSQWMKVNPRLVFAGDDRVRFRFKTNFNGFLHVVNRSTSGKYQELFPPEETGQDNSIIAGKDYLAPATGTVLGIAGPAGHEVIYWLVSPVKWTEGSGHRYKPPPRAPAPDPRPPQNIVPQCDESILRASGECVDSSAGPQGISREEKVPENLTGLGGSRDLIFIRNQETSIVMSSVPLNGPVLYEFRLAHK